MADWRAENRRRIEKFLAEKRGSLDASINESAKSSSQSNHKSIAQGEMSPGKETHPNSTIPGDVTGQVQFELDMAREYLKSVEERPKRNSRVVGTTSNASNSLSRTSLRQSNGPTISTPISSRARQRAPAQQSSRVQWGQYREGKRVGDEYYQSLLDEQAGRLTAAANKRIEVRANSFVHRASVAIAKGLGFVVTLLVIAVFVLVVVGFNQHDGPRGGKSTNGLIIFSGILLLFVGMAIQRLAELLKQWDQRRLFQLEERDPIIQDGNRANVEIRSRWDTFCISFPTYPPDWLSRRKLVLVRDNHACRRCGWSKGTPGDYRNLHVHHRVRLSRGGNNSLDNLVTLCHECHRNEEGHSHMSASPYWGRTSLFASGRRRRFRERR